MGIDAILLLLILLPLQYRDIVETWLIMGKKSKIRRNRNQDSFRKMPLNMSCAMRVQVYSDLHGPLTRYVKLCVAHAPGMPGTFSPPPTSKETASYRSRHASRHVRNARAVMHVGIANPWRRGKRSRHSRRMRNPQFYVSGKRPVVVGISDTGSSVIVW